MDKKYLIIAAVILIIAIIYLYSRSSENMSFALSRKAVDLWMQKSYDLCLPRVKAQCGDKPSDACVQKAMYECQQANSETISAQCRATLPEGICKAKCEHNSETIDCQTCLGLANAEGICKMPGITPNGNP